MLLDRHRTQLRANCLVCTLNNALLRHVFRIEGVQLQVGRSLEFANFLSRSFLDRPTASHEVFDRLGRQNRSAMVHGDMVLLVYRRRRVNDLGGHDILVNDGLDVLVDVMVSALALDLTGRGRVRSLVGDGAVVVLGSLASELRLSPLDVVVDHVSLLYGQLVVRVLLRPGGDLSVCEEPVALYSSQTYRTSLALRGCTVVWW